LNKKILYAGEHPHGSTGNSNMLMEILKRTDYSKYDVTVYAGTRGIINNPFKDKISCQLIEGGTLEADLNKENLIALLDGTTELDVLIFVGLDLWAMIEIMPSILFHKRRLGFKIVSIFPYDLIKLREDWVEWLKPVDFPCVYSEYGYGMLKSHVKNLRYFRPPLHDSEHFKPYSPERRERTKRDVFKALPENAFVFGFFGANQLRKDPQRLIKAFYQAKKEVPNIFLYLHTSTGGNYNIDQYLDDCNKQRGDVFIKAQGKYYDTDAMTASYNMIDCLVNSSLQEGLNWTIVEAMLCGTPVIAPDTTAHKELLRDGAGLLVKSSVPTFLPVATKKGNSWVDAMAIDIDDMVEKMKQMVADEKLRASCAEKGLERGKEWLAGVSDINELLQDSSRKETVSISLKKKSILFAQHSSAGDVLMTTRCLKDLRERHQGMSLAYMTSPQYMDIIMGNPYVDQIIPWDDQKLLEHSIVYNPHGDRILPGNWGRNSNSLLSDFYWKILMIKEPCDFYVGKVEPKEEIASVIKKEKRKIAIIHSTGGDPEFRSYVYAPEVAKELWKKGYFTIQVGGKNDVAGGAMLDLRGKLSFRETAWVVERSFLAITVDSFVSHLCGALGISQVCLFGSGNYNVVRPNQLTGTLICMVPDYVNYCRGLGPCSASVRECPVKCTGLHSPADILEAVESIERLSYAEKAIIIQTIISPKASSL
jgi:glycosyltransferase involved in cell wall biosynthesis/ADP-heptose:LPS heptosyltransferase